MGEKCVFKVLNSVWTECNRTTAELLNDELSYEDSYWKKGKFKREQIKYDVKLIEYRDEGKYMFLTGLLNRALDYCDAYNIPYVITNDTPLVQVGAPYIKGITFREDQKEFFDEALYHGRGVLKAATGTGKSIVIMGLMGAWDKENCLFLVHTKDLLSQMRKDLQDLNLDSLGEWSAERKEKGRVMVATIQSFKKVVTDFTDFFDVVFVDECHHVNNLDSTYGFVLQRLSAPIKLGLSASEPDTDKKKKCQEALLGPIIAELTMQRASELGILAKPELRIISVSRMPEDLLLDETIIPIPTKHKKNLEWRPTKYRTVVYNGIVLNVARNMLILQKAEEMVKENKTVLISTVEVEHGHELLRLAIANFPLLKITFLHGGTGKAVRDKAKVDFEAKVIKCVIATVVWSEGVNIKSLDCCILGAGGKSEIRVLQNIGRGLRKTEHKDTMVIYDIQDKSHKYFKDHFAKRVEIYKEMEWLEHYWNGK